MPPEPAPEADADPDPHPDPDERTIRVGETVAGPADAGLDAGQPVDLPVEDILTGRAFITGKSGSGKSNTGGVVCEQLLDRGHPVFVVDIDGEYYSLKEEYEVLHVGADGECDLRVGPEHAEKLASLALEQHVPIVLDLSGFLNEDRRDEMVAECARHLFAKEKDIRRPFLLLVEEIHEFIPEQGGLGDVGERLVKVAKRGRKRGLGICGMSQRPANVKKDFITQADWLVWHRLTWSNDTTVVRKVLDSAYADAVEGLDDGEGFLQADFLDPEIRRMQFRRKETFDAGQTPGLDDVGRPELKGISDDLKQELDAISAEANRRQDELARKEERIEELEAELEETREELERAREVSEMADQMAERVTTAMEAAAAEGDTASERAVETIQADVMEIRREKRDLEDELEEVRAERDEYRERAEEAEAELAEREAAEDLQALRDDVEELVQRNAGVLDVEAGGRVADLEREVKELREERDRLREQVHKEFSDVDELLAHEAVGDRIDELGAASGYDAEHTWDAVTALAGTEWVGKQQVAPYMSVSANSTGKILNELADADLVEKQSAGKGVEYRLDRDALEALVNAQRKQERLAEKREELRDRRDSPDAECADGDAEAGGEAGA